jgi:hypothetical protein
MAKVLGLMRIILTRRIAPAQTVPDDENDAADHTPVINPRNPVRQRKIRFDPAHLRFGEQKQIGYRGVSPNANGGDFHPYAFR